MEHEEVRRAEATSAGADRDPVLRLRAAYHDFRSHLAIVSRDDARQLVGEIRKCIDQAGPQEFPDRRDVAATAEDPLLAIDLEGHGAEPGIVVAQIHHAFDISGAMGVEEGLHDLNRRDGGRCCHPLI